MIAKQATDRTSRYRWDMSETRSVIVHGAPLAMQIPSLTIPQLIRGRAREIAAKTALTNAASGRSVSYGELEHLVGRFSAGLAALGFEPGAKLLLFMPNQPEWLIAALGAMSLGGVVSGANSTYTAEELERQLRDAGARFVITVPAFLPAVRAAAAALPGITVILLGEAPGTASFASVLACTDPEPTLEADADALVALPYSSGTSGLPKGVMLTHRNIVSNIIQCRQARATPDSAVMLAFLPMFHIYGFASSLYGLTVGCTLVTLPRFEPQSFLKAIQDHRVTHLSLVPPVLQFLAMHPLVDSYDLSSLTYIGCGAAPLGRALEQRASERLKCEVTQGFGMTESACVIAATRAGASRVGSCGELIPGTQGRVVDSDTQADVERGVAGEIWFRGPQAFQGYWNNPAMTAQTITADGWVRTGDIGYFDGDGYLFLTDRLKELIKVKGFQVAPAELEDLLLSHPSVGDCAVIGRAHERAGEIPVAYVVARGTLGQEELKDWVAQRVVGYKHLAEVIFCEAIPKSPTGKILRRVLRERDAQRTPATAPG
jgi:acyl-CoA synthetase (AMP-forming)/AMP-acid ligase II